MTHTIAIANQKGGVGKTTTVINLGVALAQMKKKTLLIDLDPQGALTAGLGIEGDNLDETIYNILIDPQIPANRLIHPTRAYLDLLPSNTDLVAAEIELIPEIRRELILQRILKPLDNWYDYILIDCPPNLSLLTVNALCASQHVIVPLQCEHFAVRGISLLLENIQRTRARLNPDLNLLGILPTMYSTGTIHARGVLEDINELFGDKVFQVVIHKSIRFADASMAYKAIVEYAPEHKGAVAYRHLAEIVVGKTE